MKTKIVMQKLFQLIIIAIAMMINFWGGLIAVSIILFEESEYLDYKQTPSGFLEHVEEDY